MKVRLVVVEMVSGKIFPQGDKTTVRFKKRKLKKHRTRMKKEVSYHFTELEQREARLLSLILHS